MKRTRADVSASDTAESDGRRVAAARDPCASWDFLVEDVQTIIVRYLDVGTKQCFAMTSKEQNKKWYNHELIKDRVKAFEQLVLDAPLCYLHRCIQKCVMKQLDHEHFLAAAAATKRQDMGDILTCLIDTFFYNYFKNTVIEPSMFSILAKAFIFSNNLEGFKWMDEQCWSLHAYKFHSEHKKDYFEYAAQSGSIEATNYLLENFTSKYELVDFTRLDLVRRNACDSRSKPYYWKDLFASTPEWQTWFDKWKTDETDRGLGSAVTFWLQCFYDGNVVSIISGLYSVWEDLSEAVRARIIDGSSSIDNRLYEKALSSTDTTIPIKLLAMGFPKPKKVSSTFMTYKLLDYISRQDTSVADWLWSANDLQIGDLSQRHYNDMVDNIVGFAKKRTQEEIVLAMRWLKAHPFDHSKTILTMLSSTAKLLSLDPKPQYPTAVATIQQQRIKDSDTDFYEYSDQEIDDDDDDDDDE